MYKKRRVYDGKNISVNIHDIIIEGKRVKREIIDQPGAAAILALDGNNVILIKQNRFPHGYILEIPGGKLEKDEDPKDCAFRELQEETGYKAKRMKHIITIDPNVGYSTLFIHCYVATGLEKVNKIKPIDDEFITVVKMDLQKLLKMIKVGKIRDAKTICAALTYATKI